MRKISFVIGERVAVIEDNKIAYGVILKIFPEVLPPVFVVQFEDGNVGKVEIDKIAKVEAKDQTEESTKDQEHKEPIEKAEITITPEEFRKISVNLVTKEAEKMVPGGMMLGLAFTAFVAKLHRALFIDEAEE